MAHKSKSGTGTCMMLFNFTFASFVVLLANCLTSVTAKEQGFLSRVEDAGDQKATMYCDPVEMQRFWDYVELDLDDNVKEGNRDRHLERNLLGKCSGGCKVGYPLCRFTGTGCISSGRRRALQMLVRNSLSRRLGDEDDKIKDVKEDSCSTKVKRAKKRFDEIVPQLAPHCQDLVRNYGHFTCEEIIPCTITHLSAWNVAKNKELIQKLPASGKTICNDVAVTFEAVTNFNIGPLQFNLVGPSSFNVTKVGFHDPYFFTSGSPSNSTLEGLFLKIGYYKLDAWPEGDLTKMVTSSFRVKSC